MNHLFAERIGGAGFGQSNQIYKFERIRLAKEAAIERFPNRLLLDLGIGEPDAMADARVVAALHQAAQKPENRGYPDNGGPLFKKAVSVFMRQVFGVNVDPQHEVCHSIGAKAALSILPAAFVDSGDCVLMTTPGYPDFGIHAKYYGGEVYPLPLIPENHFLPDLENIPTAVLNRTKVLVLNYPNNPTGALASEEFFQSAIRWASHWGILIVHDAAYAALSYAQKPLSILQFEGAKDVCLEVHTLSKAFNMVGWRLGWVCGGRPYVQAYMHVKDRTDCGQFLAIQEAAAEALSYLEIPQQTGDKYARRLARLKAILQKLDWQVYGGGGGFFLYAQAPKDLMKKFESAQALSTWVIKERGIVTVPWDEAGPYLRFSVTFKSNTLEAEEAFFKELEDRLGK
jgi:LL-diaminopimelate aminotransferase